MKRPIKHLTIALLAIPALAGCMGPAGNPGGQPYADQPGGAIAVKPEPTAAVAYDPNAVPPAFNDMQIGQPALNPSPAPAPVYRPPSR
jgi:hypothetical protein